MGAECPASLAWIGVLSNVATSLALVPRVALLDLPSGPTTIDGKDSAADGLVVWDGTP